MGSFLCTPKVLWLLRSANVVKSTSTESLESQRSDHVTLPNMVMWCEWSGHRYAVTHGNCWLVCLTAYKTVTWSFSSLINKCLVWVFGVSVWRSRDGTSTAKSWRITHQIHVTRPTFRREIYLHCWLLLQSLFTHQIPRSCTKRKEGGQERGSRKESNDQGNQAGTWKKDINFLEFPLIVENREIMEVPVLEEGEMFDPDIFLERLTQH